MLEGLFAAIIAAVQPGLAASSSPPPVEAYAADAALSAINLSSSGRTLALQDQSGKKPVLALMRRDSAGLSRETIGLGDMPLAEVLWVGDEDLLIFRQTVLGSNPLLGRQRVSKGLFFNLTSRKFTPFITRPRDISNVVAGGPMQVGVQRGEPVVYARALKSTPTFQLVQVSARDGGAESVGDASFDARGWVVTPAGAIVARALSSERDPVGRVEMRAGAVWKTVALDASLGRPELISLGRASDTALVFQNGVALEAAADGTINRLSPPGAVVTGSGTYKGTGRLRWLSFSDDRTPVFFDAALAGSWAKIVGALPVGISASLVGVDDAGREIVFATSGDGVLGKLFWSHSDGSTDLVGGERPGISDAQVGHVERIALKAGDGFPLSATLTLPVRRPARALPLLVTVRNFNTGPSGPGFDPDAQFFASRGYAVLDVDYRGAAGMSAAHTEAGRGQAGRRMQSDLSDTVAELAKSGRIDAGRVCIIGWGGYGGYAALAGVTLQHGVYRCSVASDPVADPAVLLRAPDRDSRGSPWAAYLWWSKAVAKAEVQAISPLAHARDTDAPVLLFKSAEMQTESQVLSFDRALRLAGKSPEKVLLETPLQSLATPTGRRDYYVRVLDFLAKHNPA